MAYYGVSLSFSGPIFAAVDPRIKTCVLLSGGTPRYSVPPHIDPVNFAPRSRVPTLMINGKDDFLTRWRLHSGRFSGCSARRRWTSATSCSKAGTCRPRGPTGSRVDQDDERRL